MRKTKIPLEGISDFWKLLTMLIYTAVVLTLGALDAYFSLPIILIAAAILFIAIATLMTVYRPIKLERQLNEFLEKFHVMESHISWQKLKEEGIRENVLIVLEEMIEAEKNSDEIWILNPDFSYDLTNFKDVVLQNLSKGKKYVYIYPSTKRAQNNLEQLRNVFKESLKEKWKKINQQVELYEVEGELITMIEALYNPFHPKKKLAVVVPSKEFPYFFRLVNEQIDPLRDKFVYMKEIGERKYL
jgi:hypothetical protein